MKPAKFEYHAPERSADVVDLLAQLGDDAKVLAGRPEPDPDARDAPRRVRAPGRHRPGRRAPRHRTSERRRCGSAPAPPRRRSSRAPRSRRPSRCSPVPPRSSATSRSATAEPSAAASPTPTRPPSTRRSRSPSTPSWRSLSPAGSLAPIAASRLLHRPVEHGHGGRRAARGRAVPGVVGPLRFRHRGVRTPARRLRASPAPRRRSSSTTTTGSRRCAIGLFGLGASAGARHRRRDRGDRAPARPTLDGARIGELAMSGSTDIPSDLHGSADYRRRVGAAMVARAWTAAIREALDG